jgi:hypothetical protein
VRQLRTARGERWTSGSFFYFVLPKAKLFGSSLSVGRPLSLAGVDAATLLSIRPWIRTPRSTSTSRRSSSATRAAACTASWAPPGSAPARTPPRASPPGTSPSTPPPASPRGYTFPATSSVRLRSCPFSFTSTAAPSRSTRPSPAAHFRFLSALVPAARVVAVSVDYGLAPEQGRPGEIRGHVRNVRYNAVRGILQ